MGSDLLAVEAAILDKNLVGARSGHDHTRDVDSRYVALERNRIAYRTTLFGGEFDSHRAKKFIVGMISGEREDKVVLDFHLAFRGVQHDVICLDRLDRAAEVSSDLTVLDAVLDIGENPVLHVRMHLRPAMDEGDSRSMAP